MGSVAELLGICLKCYSMIKAFQSLAERAVCSLDRQVVFGMRDANSVCDSGNNAFNLFIW